MMNALICDCIEEDASLLKTMLAESGFDVQTSVFNCPLQAFEHIKSGKSVDICFFDIIMSGMSGITLASRLRKKRNFTGEIVFVTSTNDFASESYKVDAFNYFLKPITCEKIKLVMGALLLKKQKGPEYTSRMRLFL
jgi:two-component SAPR family response regulator